MIQEKKIWKLKRLPRKEVYAQSVTRNMLTGIVLKERKLNRESRNTNYPRESLGRTMMVDAKLVLLDEVGAGVNRTLLKDIGSAILRLNKEQGYTFCMIEHDMEFISRLCDPVIVLAEGSVLFEGTPDEVKKNEKVIESYLGRGSKSKDEN